MTSKVMNVLLLLVVSIALILGAGYFAYQTTNQGADRKQTVPEFLGLQPIPSLKSILIGMSVGLVFGFIDNLGLYYGMKAFGPYLPKDPLLAAGLGNTFSNSIGVFLATFVGVIISNKSNVDNYSIVSEAGGMILGCLLGTYLPRLFL